VSDDDDLLPAELLDDSVAGERDDAADPEHGRHAGAPADERVIEHDHDEPHLFGERLAPPPPTVTHTPTPEGLPVMPPGAPQPTHVLPAAHSGTGAPIGPRRQRTLERRRRRRRNRLLALVAVVVVAIVAGAVSWAGGRHHRAAPVAVSRTQQTLLLGIGDTGAPAEAVALLGVDGTGQASTLLVPQSTIVDGPGGTVGGSYPISPADEFAGAVSDCSACRSTPPGG